MSRLRTRRLRAHEYGHRSRKRHAASTSTPNIRSSSSRGQSGACQREQPALCRPRRACARRGEALASRRQARWRSAGTSPQHFGGAPCGDGGKARVRLDSQRDRGAQRGRRHRRATAPRRPPSLAVYSSIIMPESMPGSSARNGVNLLIRGSSRTLTRAAMRVADCASAARSASSAAASSAGVEVAARPASSVLDERVLAARVEFPSEHTVQPDNGPLDTPSTCGSTRNG